MKIHFLAMYSLFMVVLPASYSSAYDDSFYDPDPRKKWSEYVIFYKYEFLDYSDFVAVRGGLNGEGLQYKNNSISGLCDSKKNKCEILIIGDLGDNAVTNPMIHEFSILKWNPSTIIAMDIEPCFTSTITISRASKTATWAKTRGGESGQEQYCGAYSDKSFFRKITDPLGLQKKAQATGQPPYPYAIHRMP